MLRSAKRTADREAGITLVLVAMALVVLLVFAAFAVDLGGLYNARRQDQTAADTGALAGAQDLITSDVEVANQVISHVEGTLEVADGSLDFDSCGSDPEALDTEVNGLSCITKDTAGNLLRVKVPMQELESVFGAVIGQEDYEHSAFAIAGLVREGFGGVLPFALFVDGAGHACLRTDNPSTPVSPCAGSSTGDSGLLNFGFYGNQLVNTTASCAGNGSSSRLPNNVAVGVDHNLTLRANIGVVPYLDQDDCPDPTDPRPNGTDTINTAGNPPGLSEGLFSGSSFSDGGPARLQREAEVPYAEREDDIEGHDVDSTPLWQFIDPAATSTNTDIPAQCEQSVFTGALADISTLPPDIESHLEDESLEVRMEKLLERCMAHYTNGSWDDGGALTPDEDRVGCSPGNAPCTGVLFGRNSVVQQPEVYDIQYTPRFAYVPYVWENLGSNSVTFRRFVPIFIQRLCIGNQQCNQGTFSPGVPWQDSASNVDNDSVNAISGFIFDQNMLPNNLGGANAPYEINVNLFVRLLR